MASKVQTYFRSKPFTIRENVIVIDMSLGMELLRMNHSIYAATRKDLNMQILKLLRSSNENAGTGHVCKRLDQSLLKNARTITHTIEKQATGEVKALLDQETEIASIHKYVNVVRCMLYSNKDQMQIW